MNDRSNESIIKLEPTRDVLTELFRNSAIKVLQAALELEVSDIMASFESLAKVILGVQFRDGIEQKESKQKAA